MGGKDNLHIGIELQDEVDESLLPVDVQAHFRLVHEEHVGLPVFHQDGEHDGQHLLLAARQLIGHERFANLREAYLVLRPHNLLARFAKEVVDDVLEHLLRLAYLLSLLCRIGRAALQSGNHLVADVHLIV